MTRYCCRLFFSLVLYWFHFNIWFRFPLVCFGVSTAMVYTPLESLWLGDELYVFDAKRRVVGNNNKNLWTNETLSKRSLEGKSGPCLRKNLQCREKSIQVALFKSFSERICNRKQWTSKFMAIIFGVTFITLKKYAQQQGEHSGLRNTTSTMKGHHEREG